MVLSHTQKNKRKWIFVTTNDYNYTLFVNFGPIATFSFLTFGPMKEKKNVLLTFKAKWRVRVRSGCLQRSERERSGANGNFNVTTSNATVLELAPEKERCFKFDQGQDWFQNFGPFEMEVFLHMVYGCLWWNMEIPPIGYLGYASRICLGNLHQPIMICVYLAWWFMWLRYFSINPWCKEFLQKVYCKETWREHIPE